MVLDNGEALFDSRVIVEYLNALDGCDLLIPTGGERIGSSQHHLPMACLTRRYCRSTKSATDRTHTKWLLGLYYSRAKSTAHLISLSTIY